MTTKSDLDTQIARGLVELINSKSCSPSLEEIRTNLCDAYLTAMLSIKVSKTPLEMCRNLAEQMADKRAGDILALISAKPSSPTVQEIMNVLRRTPQRGDRKVRIMLRDKP